MENINIIAGWIVQFVEAIKWCFIIWLAYHVIIWILMIGLKLYFIFIDFVYGK